MTAVRERLQLPKPRELTLVTLQKLVDDLNNALGYICEALPITQDHQADTTAGTVVADFNSLLAKLEAAGVLKAT